MSLYISTRFISREGLNPSRELPTLKYDALVRLVVPATKKVE